MLESAYRETNSNVIRHLRDDARLCTIGNRNPRTNAQQTRRPISLFGFRLKCRSGDHAGLSVYADGLIIGVYEPLVPGRLLRSPKRASKSIVWVVDQAAATMGGKGSCSSAMRPIARFSSGVSGMVVKP